MLAQPTGARRALDLLASMVSISGSPVRTQLGELLSLAGSGTRGLPQWCSLFRARKVATPKQIAEATIGSERVPLGVDRQEDEVDVS